MVLLTRKTACLVYASFIVCGPSKQAKKMTDTRYFSKEFMTEFIRVYRQHTALWKIKSKEYLNKNLKNIGITELIEVCKQFKIMEVDKNFVLKKIQSIRGSFRKELKKIKDSQRSGASADDIYEPTLWYFELLQFTIDQETATESISNMGSPTSEVSDSCDERQDQQSNERENPSQDEEGESSQNEVDVLETFPLPAAPSKKLKRNKCNSNNESTANFMKACTAALSTKSSITEEFQAVGMNISAKLQKMQTSQQVYAEYLIQKVLTWGALNKLSENTDLINNIPFVYGPSTTQQPTTTQGYNVVPPSNIASSSSSTAAHFFGNFSSLTNI